MADDQQTCPKCGSPLGDIVETSTGKKLQRCSTGFWNKELRKNEGCDYIKWFAVEPVQLDEKCPKCDSPLIMQVTRFGKKMEKCSTAGWDAAARQATGYTYIRWLKSGDVPVSPTGEEFLPPEPES